MPKETNPVVFVNIYFDRRLYDCLMSLIYHLLDDNQPSSNAAQIRGNYARTPVPAVATTTNSPRTAVNRFRFPYHLKLRHNHIQRQFNGRVSFIRTIITGRNTRKALTIKRPTSHPSLYNQTRRSTTRRRRRSLIQSRRADNSSMPARQGQRSLLRYQERIEDSMCTSYTHIRSPLHMVGG